MEKQTESKAEIRVKQLQEWHARSAAYRAERDARYAADREESRKRLSTRAASDRAVSLKSANTTSQADCFKCKKEKYGVKTDRPHDDSCPLSLSFNSKSPSTKTNTFTKKNPPIKKKGTPTKSSSKTNNNNNNNHTSTKNQSTKKNLPIKKSKPTKHNKKQPESNNKSIKTNDKPTKKKKETKSAVKVKNQSAEMHPLPLSHFPEVHPITPTETTIINMLSTEDAKKQLKNTMNKKGSKLLYHPIGTRTIISLDSELIPH